MNLRQDTINKLVETIKLDKEDLHNLSDTATQKIAKLRNMNEQNNNEIKAVKTDLNNKQKALSAIE